jgi:hypothetical protein
MAPENSRACEPPHSKINQEKIMMRIAAAFLFVLHGLIHLFGFAKAFGYGNLPELGESITAPVGVLWLAAASLCLAAAAALFLAPRWWWAVGALAVVTSQAAILTAWPAAMVGTVVNLLLLGAVLYGFAARGPLSLRAEYERHLGHAWPSVARQDVTEADLEALPVPLQRYLCRAGVVGRPRVDDFRATFTGRIRSAPDSAWMTFTADQLNILNTPRRFFLMDARMKGLPVDVLHAFDEHGASMRVKLLSVRSMVDAEGAELTHAETVTLFNDLCVLAPSALITSNITWELVDPHRVNAHFTLGPNTIAAELTFDDDGDLVDFTSDDRAQSSPDGRAFTRVRWTTPVRDHARVGPARVPTRGETRWHPDSGAWTYGEFELTSLAYNVAHRQPPIRPSMKPTVIEPPRLRLNGRPGLNHVTRANRLPSGCECRANYGVSATVSSLEAN